jgi:hypothetical protein
VKTIYRPNPVITEVECRSDEDRRLLIRLAGAVGAEVIEEINDADGSAVVVAHPEHVNFRALAYAAGVMPSWAPDAEDYEAWKEDEDLWGDGGLAKNTAPLLDSTAQ